MAQHNKTEMSEEEKVVFNKKKGELILEIENLHAKQDEEGGIYEKSLTNGRTQADLYCSPIKNGTFQPQPAGKHKKTATDVGGTLSSHKHKQSIAFHN